VRWHLDTLAPAERLTFVLHDMFAVPFEEIAPIVGRSPVATRQLASRARRRVRGVSPRPGNDPVRQREVVTTFLAASRRGDFAGLVAVLDPDVALRADQAAVQLGAPAETVGVQAIARLFSRYAGGARLALIDGLAGAVWAPGGRPRVSVKFVLTDGKITAIELIAQAERVREQEVVFLEHSTSR